MENKKGFHFGFIVAVGIFLQYVLAGGIFFGAAGMFIVPVTESLNIGQGQFSLYLTIQNLAMATCAVCAPKLLSKFRFRSLNIVGSILSAIGFGMMAFAKSVFVIYVGGAFIGFSLTFLTFLSPGTLLPRWFKNKLGTMLGFVASGVSIGGVIFNPIISALLNRDPLFGFSESWRSAYLVLAILVLVICLGAALFMLCDSPEDKGLRAYGDDSAVGEGGSIKLKGVEKNVAIKSSAFVWFVVMIICWNLASGIYSFFPAYASVTDVPAYVVGIIGSVTMVGGIIGGFVIGNLNDKLGGHKGGLFGGIAGVIGLLIIIFGGKNAIIMLAGAGIYGLYNAIANVQLPAMTTTLFGNLDYDAIFQRAAGFAPWFGAVSYAAWGFIFDATGSYIAMMVGGIALSALTAIAGLLAFSASRKLKVTEK